MNIPQNRHGSRHFIKGAEGETVKLVPGSDLKQWKGAQNWVNIGENAKFDVEKPHNHAFSQ